MTSTISEFLAPGLLAAVLIGAAATDLRWRRIPNLLTLGGAALGLTLALVGGGPEALWRSLAGWLLGIALLTPFFLIRAMGAGDVKLLGAVGAFGGPGLVLGSILWGGIFGGVFALALLIRRGQLVPVIVDLCLIRRFPRLDDAGAITMPYGVAIAAGGLLARFLSGGGGF